MKKYSKNKRRCSTPKQKYTLTARQIYYGVDSRLFSLRNAMMCLPASLVRALVRF